MADMSKNNGMRVLGELIPTGGGDTIPLMKDRLLVGRRSGCDIMLNFPNVSTHHCQLFVEEGYWFAKDLDSRNGTRVDGKRITRKSPRPRRPDPLRQARVPDRVLANRSRRSRSAPRG